MLPIASDHTTSAEVWKPVPGFPGYEVSNWGRVVSWRQGNERRFRKLVPQKSGYLLVMLYSAPTSPGVYRPTGRLVHRLVLEAFVGPRPDGMECRHLDGNPANNRLDNLCWGTHVENVADRRRHGTEGIGEKNIRARITEADVLEIRRLWSAGVRQIDLVKRYDLADSTISNICLRKTWKHI